MHKSTVRIDNAGKRFGSAWVWRNLDAHLQPGEMIALTGASGAGKSTLLESMGLLTPIDEGRIEVFGRDLTRATSSVRRHFYRETVGFLFQNFGLVEGWTAARNVSIGAAYSTRGSRARKAIVASALERFGLDEFASAPVNRLSGGQQQRVALARIVVKNPALVLADEPTSALDEANGAVVLAALREHASRGAVVVVSTHNASLAEQCDAVIAL